MKNLLPFASCTPVKTVRISRGFNRCAQPVCNRCAHLLLVFPWAGRHQKTFRILKPPSRTNHGADVGLGDDLGRSPENLAIFHCVLRLTPKKNRFCKGFSTVGIGLRHTEMSRVDLADSRAWWIAGFGFNRVWWMGGFDFVPPAWCPEAIFVRRMK